MSCAWLSLRRTIPRACGRIDTLGGGAHGGGGGGEMQGLGGGGVPRS